MAALSRDGGGAICLLVFGCLGVQCHALDPQKSITQYVQVALSDKEGLPQNSVYSIAQTNDGYLWFGTEEGIARFDGVRVTVMNTLKNKTLVDNYVNVLTAGRDGSLWIGTRSGVIRYKDGIFRTYFSPGSPINSILEDRSGRIWVGSMAGLYCIHDDQVRRYTARDGLPNAGIRAIVADRRGVLWLATTEGLVSLANGQFRTYSFRDGVPAAPILALASSHDGSLWIATTDGLVRWRGKLLQRWPAADFPAQARIASLLEDRDEVLWLGFEHHGIASVWQGQIRRYTTLQGLPSDEVDRIFEDRSGHLWIGLLEGGVLELRDGPFSAIGKREGLSTDMVWSVLQARDGSLWIGTDGNGLNHIDRNGKVHVYTVADGLPDNTIFALCEAGDGTIWIGSEGGALTRFKKGRFTRYRDPEAKDSRLAEILQGPGGSDLWLGFHGKNGLVRFHDGRFLHYTVPGLLNAMTFAPDGAIWVGTDHAGVSRVKDGLVTNYTTAQGLLSDFAPAIYVDRDGVVWAGTSPGGLNRIKNGHITTYSVAQGLFDLTVGAIVEDASGNLWMTCNHGIFRVSKQELTDYAEGRVHAVHSVVYGTADGLRAAECNFAAYPAVWQGASGRLWFATVGGVATIDPGHMQNRRADPQIQIECILLNQNLVRVEGASLIGRGSDDLEVQYTAPDFTAPDRLRFRYRLLHFDRDWVNVGGRREAYYTKLPPGRYVFEAQVAEENGEWTPYSQSFALILQPRFWQTDWFKIASALIIVSGGAHS